MKKEGKTRGDFGESGFGSEKLSYENGSYEDDMDKAKRLVRDGKWDQAVTAYHEIVEKAPERAEPRFHLAQIYQKVGYFGLALGEYRKIVDRKVFFGPNHVYVLESERVVFEMEELLRRREKRGP